MTILSRIKSRSIAVPEAQRKRCPQRPAALGGGRIGSKSRGFTLVELAVGAVISLTVIGAAYVLLTASVKTGRKSQDLSAAVQSGAMLLHVLETDLANYIPVSSGTDPVGISETENEIALEFNRKDTSTKIDFENWTQWKTETDYSVKYHAAKNDKGLWEIQRIPQGKEAEAMHFGGVWAQAVRFTAFSLKEKNQWFMRVAFLLMGDNVNPAEVDSFNRPKPYLMTALYYLPMK